jgi:hypothetical protein
MSPVCAGAGLSDGNRNRFEEDLLRWRKKCVGSRWLEENETSAGDGQKGHHILRNKDL